MGMAWQELNLYLPLGKLQILEGLQFLNFLTRLKRRSHPSVLCRTKRFKKRPIKRKVLRNEERSERNEKKRWPRRSPVQLYVVIMLLKRVVKRARVFLDQQ